MNILNSFLHFLNLIVGNQQGNIGGEVEATDYDMSKYDVDDSSESDQNSGNNDDNSSQSQDQDNNDQNNSIEDQLKAFNANPEKGANEEENAENDQNGSTNLLDMVNNLGMIRDSLPLEMSSENEIKEAIMKGMDYTVKTQELAKEREETEAQLSEQVTAHEQAIQEFETEKEKFSEDIHAGKIFGEILEQVKDQYPEVFQEIQGEFQRNMSLYQNSINNPVINAQNQRMKALEDKLSGQDETALNQQAETIKADWEKGLGEAQKEFGSKLKSLGITPKWSDVQKAWQADTSKSMTVQAALFSVYGPAITKGLESQKRLADTRAKSSQRNGGSFNNSNGQGKDTRQAPKFRTEEYSDSINAIADKYA